MCNRCLFGVLFLHRIDWKSPSGVKANQLSETGLTFTSILRALESIAGFVLAGLYGPGRGLVRRD